MPHRLNFLRGNGTQLSNEQTPLIAHTANDIVTSQTGLYSDRQGLNVANSYGYFNANGCISFPSAFTGRAPRRWPGGLTAQDEEILERALATEKHCG